MRKIASWLLLCSAFVLAAGCGSEHHETNSATNADAPRASPRPAIPQVAIPIDLEKPPTDAARTASGIVFTRRFTTAGRQPTADQVVLVRYTGGFSGPDIRLSPRPAEPSRSRLTWRTRPPASGK